MNEERLMRRIFGESKWRNKYEFDWCDLCDCAIVICNEPECHGTTCNCTGCEKCINDADYKDFENVKNRVEFYLTEDEIKIYHKARRIKELIMHTIGMGDKEIDFQKLKAQGHLSRSDEEMF